MSKEHFWSTWMHELLCRDGKGEHIHKIVSADSKINTNQKIEKNLQRQGDVTTKKIRVVCKTCNNGWMSEIETQAKPILTKLISGCDCCLTPEQSHALAIWIAMKVIVSEHSEGGTQVTPAKDRCDFYKNKTIPEYFRIFIGNHSTNHSAGFMRQSYLLSAKGYMEPQLKGLQRNTEVVSFYCGKLFVYICACRVKGLDIDNLFDGSVLNMIYPLGAANITMPISTLTEKQVNDIVYALKDFVDSDKVRYGGPINDHLLQKR